MIHPFDMLLISILFFESLIMAVFLCYTLERKYSVRKGLCILRSIAEKYHGRFAVQKEQGKFTAVLELKPGGKIEGNKISSTSP